MSEMMFCFSRRSPSTHLFSLSGQGCWRLERKKQIFRQKLKTNIARIFMNTFSSSLTNLIQRPLIDCLQFTTAHLDGTRVENPTFLTCSNQFAFHPISPSELVKRTRKLDDTSAAGSTSIPTRVFTHCANELGLSFLFSVCIKTHRFPDDFKMAHLFTKGKETKTRLTITGQSLCSRR